MRKAEEGKMREGDGGRGQKGEGVDLVGGGLIITTNERGSNPITIISVDALVRISGVRDCQSAVVEGTIIGASADGDIGAIITR